MVAHRRPTVRLHVGSPWPWKAARPRRSWLWVTAGLWATLWLQFLVVPASWNRLVALVLFGLACVDTVAFGVSQRGRGISEVVESAAAGVLVLAVLSWTPLLAVGVGYSVAVASIGPLFGILLFGLPVSLALAIVGYLLLLFLLGLGRLLAWAWRR
jgi:hypothetical protein